MFPSDRYRVLRRAPTRPRRAARSRAWPWPERPFSSSPAWDDAVARRLSWDRDDGVDATWSREDSIAATASRSKFQKKTLSRRLLRLARRLVVRRRELQRRGSRAGTCRGNFASTARPPRARPLVRVPPFQAHAATVGSVKGLFWAPWVSATRGAVSQSGRHKAQNWPWGQPPLPYNSPVFG